MLIEEQFKEKVKLSTVTVDERKKEFSIEECLEALSFEGLEKLYSHYDMSSFFDDDHHHSKKVTRNQKIKYLFEEIPGQFIDYYSFMIDNKTKLKIKKICRGEEIKINEDIISLAYFGFIYFREKNNEIEIILPYELVDIIEYISR